MKYSIFSSNFALSHEIWYQMSLPEQMKNLFRFQIELELYWFLRRGENSITQRKTSWSREDDQQQTQTTYGMRDGKWSHKERKVSAPNSALSHLSLSWNQEG